MIGARSQDDFVAARSADWKALDRLLLDGGSLHTLDGAAISRAAALYRSLCTDLMRCRAARVTPDLAAHLDALAGRAHAALYGAQPFRLPGIIGFFARGFPRALRANGRLFAVACALFFLPFAVGLIGALASDDFSTKVLPAASLEAMADAYSKGFAGGRDAGTDTGMAGFYVYNNVGIAFRCFATGILYGAGSLFFLVYNGLVTGTVAGYVMSAGHGGNIWTFMCGHAPFELTAIVIAGGAGLQMGYALVDTRGRTRVGSLRRAAPAIAQQILGAAAMLLVAALVEGFWSPSALPPPVKWSAAALFTVAVVLYLALAGRGAPARLAGSGSRRGRPPNPRLRPNQRGRREHRRFGHRPPPANARRGARPRLPPLRLAGVRPLCAPVGRDPAADPGGLPGAALRGRVAVGAVWASRPRRAGAWPRGSSRWRWGGSSSPRRSARGRCSASSGAAWARTWSCSSSTGCSWRRRACRSSSAFPSRGRPSSSFTRRASSRARARSTPCAAAGGSSPRTSCRCSAPSSRSSSSRWAS